ncbi:MAG TPA: hypothetical protein VMD05_10110 [Candidatus Nanoarchaeia archaeon]|nr:hypothetical protein [Candidatus Nanoarchaeia archaeon]
MLNIEKIQVLNMLPGSPPPGNFDAFSDSQKPPTASEVSWSRVRKHSVLQNPALLRRLQVDI